VRTGIGVWGGGVFGSVLPFTEGGGEIGAWSTTTPKFAPAAGASAAAGRTGSPLG